MSKEQSVFEKLSSINVNDKVEKKNGLSYVSWIFAWSEVKKVYPSANYRVVNFDNKPYLFDEHLGYLVQTEVTIEGETIPMQLPVMDNMNRAQRHIVYQKFNKDIQPATMFDINTAIMRCLTKNLAMFGLGLYIYAGEDIPNESDQDREVEKIKVPSISETLDYAKKLGVTEQQLIDKYNANMGEKEQITKFIEISDSHRLALYKLLQKQEKAKK
jgi:hypothetical protein